MKKLFVLLLVLAAIAAAIAIYLIATTPTQSRGVHFPLSAADRALISHVPATADAYALIPTAAALDAKLRANPITRDAIASWTSEHELPRPWMIGDADLVAWREEGRTRYYLNLDPFRAFIVRLFGRADVLASPGTEETSAPPSADRLPAGDAFVVQRESRRGAYPPIPRPTASSIAITPDTITIVSRAANSDPPSPPLAAEFPRTAILTASFGSAPRIIDDLNRLFGARVSSLFDSGGSIALYGVEIGKLLPRPLGVFAVPADRRQEFQNVVDTAKQGEILGYQVRTAERDGQLLLSFDPSLDTYLKDAADRRQWPSARWAVRADPARLVPILNQLNDNLGLQLVSPRLSRGVRDANHWIGALEKARAIEAIDSTDGTAEELRVTITAK